MDIQGKQIPETILLRIKKVYELAVKGTEGEKGAANTLLDQLCKKYGVDKESLGTEQKQEYTFAVRNSIYPLFIQVYVSIYDATDRFKEDLKMYESMRKGYKVFKVQFTPSEYIEFSQLFGWHKENYQRERRRIKKLIYQSYLNKYRLYPKETAEDIKEQQKRKKGLAMDDLLAINSIAQTMRNNSYHKKLEETNN